MNQQSFIPVKPHPPKVYTEEERSLRWKLIIEAILRDSGESTPVVAHTAPPQPANQLQKVT